MLEDFFKVPPSHMKVPPDHYKGLQATSKGHAPLLIPVAAMGKCKQANEFQSRHYGHPTSLIVHEQFMTQWNAVYMTSRLGEGPLGCILHCHYMEHGLRSERESYPHSLPLDVATSSRLVNMHMRVELLKGGWNNIVRPHTGHSLPCVHLRAPAFVCVCLRSSAFVFICIRLRASACICVRPCAPASLPP